MYYPAPLDKLTDALKALPKGFNDFSQELKGSPLNRFSRGFNPFERLTAFEDELKQLPGWKQLETFLINLDNINLGNGARRLPLTGLATVQSQQLQNDLKKLATSANPADVEAIQAIAALYEQIFNFYGFLFQALLTENGTLPPQTFDPLFTTLTPASELVFAGFGDFQLVFGRSGIDTLYPFDQSLNPSVQPPVQIDLFFGDSEVIRLALLQDTLSILSGTPPVSSPPFLPTSPDRFVLGDRRTSYYNRDGYNDFAFIYDFNPQQDIIQLRGSAADYQTVFVPLLGTAIFEKTPGSTSVFEDDLVGIVFNPPGNYNINLAAPYFQFVGTTPPPGPINPRVKQLGTAGLDIPSSITVDPFGNVYVSGLTNGALSGQNNGSYDIWINKYDNSGNLLWRKQFGSSKVENSFGTTTDQQGNFYIVGSTAGNLITPLQAQSADAFVIKFDGNGNQIWSRQFGENLLSGATDVAVDGQGNVYVSGLTVKPDPRPQTDPNRVFPVEDDFWATKLDVNGNRLWFTEVGAPLNSPALFDEAYGIVLNVDGSVYTTGWTYGDFSGQGQFNSYDIQIAKYNRSTGELQKFSPNPGQLVNQFGTPTFEFPYGFANDSQGNLYNAGWTYGNLGGQNAGREDVWLAKTRLDGTQEWIRQFGTSGADGLFLGGLVIDAQDNIFLTGYTNGSLGGANAGSFDAWVARYDTSGNRIWIRQFGTAEYDYATNLTVDNRGNIFVTGFTEGSFGAINAGAVDAWVLKLDANTGSFLNFNGSPFLNGKGGQKTFTVNRGETITIAHFGGIGRGAAPAAAVISEVDTLQFKGADLTARNLLLTQKGADLELTFDGVANTKVILKNFTLDNLDNLRRSTGATVDLGNILFNSQNRIQDSFDVFDANSTQAQIWNRNTVTFLNNLNNVVKGFDRSNDVINALGGDDTIYALSGNDLVRGGAGNDRLFAGAGNDGLFGDEGNDYLDGGAGNDNLRGGQGADHFVFSSGKRFARADLGVDTITDFTALDSDKIVLSKSTFTALRSSVGNGFSNATDFAVVSNGSAARLNGAFIVYDTSSGGLYYNQNGVTPGLGSGDLFATLAGKPTLTASNFRIIA